MLPGSNIRVRGGLGICLCGCGRSCNHLHHAGGGGGASRGWGSRGRVGLVGSCFLAATFPVWVSFYTSGGVAVQYKLPSVFRGIIRSVFSGCLAQMGQVGVGEDPLM